MLSHHLKNCFFYIFNNSSARNNTTFDLIFIYLFILEYGYFRCFKNLEQTRQVSSMFHSARPTLSPVANIVFALIIFALKSGDGRTTCAKTMITTGHDCGSALVDQLFTLANLYNLIVLNAAKGWNR